MTTWLDTRTGSSITSQKPSRAAREHRDTAHMRAIDAAAHVVLDAREVGVHQLMPVLLGSSAAEQALELVHVVLVDAGSGGRRHRGNRW